MKISGSILGIKDNFKKIEMMNNCGVHYIHLDVMDGKYVDNYALAYDEVLEIRKNISLPLDIHFMVKDPMEYIKRYKTFNPKFISFHIETTNKVLEIIHYLKDNNIKAGIALNPNTPISKIEKYLDKIDYILIMSVEPGLGGQAFIKNIIEKIEELKKIRNEKNYKFLIEVDGGINDITIKNLDIDIAVVGSYITNSDYYIGQVKKLGDQI